MVEHTKHPHRQHSSGPHHAVKNDIIHMSVAEAAIAGVKHIAQKFDGTPYDFGGKFINGHFINGYKADEKAHWAKSNAAKIALRPGVEPAASRSMTVARGLSTDLPAPQIPEFKSNHTYNENGIDCAGFVYLAVGEAMKNTNNVKGYDVFDDHHIDFCKTAGNNGANIPHTSEGIYDYFTQKTGVSKRPLTHLNHKDFAPGTLTIIAIDHGKTRTGFDANRKLGIDHIVLTDGKNVYQSSSGAGVHTMPLTAWLDHTNSKTAKYFLANPLALAKTRADKELANFPVGKALLVDLHQHGFEIHDDPTANKGNVVADKKLVIIPARLTPQWQIFSLANNAAAAKLIAHGLRTDSLEAKAFIQAQVVLLAADMKTHGDPRLEDACRKMFGKDAMADFEHGHQPSLFTVYTHAKLAMEKQIHTSSDLVDTLGINRAVPAANHKVRQTELAHPTDASIAKMMGIILPKPGLNLNVGVAATNNFSFSG